MFDFERFINACHTDILAYAKIPHDYIVLDGPKMETLLDDLSPGFWKQFGVNHSGMSRQHLLNQINLRNFTHTMAALVQHPPNGSGNIIIQGLPSAGKSIALSRIAKAAVEEDTGERVIHLCTMQFYSQPEEVKIRGWADLWKIILRCHVNDDIASSNLDLEEFVKLHTDHGRGLTILVDTLDLLTYGVDSQFHDVIVRAWSELVDELAKNDVPVVWTCRTHELNILRNQSSSPKNMHIIDLPPLAKEAVAKKVNSLKSIAALSENQIWGLSYMLHAFPVMASFMGARSRYRPSDKFLTQLNKRFNRMEFAVADLELSPLSWVMTKQDMSLGTDVMYKLIRHEIIQRIYRSDTTGIRSIPDGEKEAKRHLLSKWLELVETRFYVQAIARRNRYGSRLIVPSSLLVGSLEYDEVINPHQTNDGEASIEDDESVLSLFVHYGVQYGLFNKFPEHFSFSHQLFAEYCVWARSKHGGKNDPLTAEELVGRYPSLALRYLDEVVLDKSLQQQYARWVSPFIAVSNLYLYRDNPKIPSGWKGAMKFSCSLNKVEPSTSAKDSFSPLQGLNTDQKEIIGDLPLDGSPLFLNAPPGTGKTHIAANFIHKMLDVSAGSTYQESPSVLFLTMSPYLSESFTKRYNDYFDNKQGYESVQLKSLSVNQLLWSLRNHVLGEVELTWDDFISQILTKERFISIFKEHDFSQPLISRYSAHGLWYEFNNKILKRDGQLCRNLNEYLENTGMSRGEYLSIFYQLNDESRSNNARRDAQQFINILEDQQLIGRDVRFYTQAKICEDVIREIFQRESQEPSIAERLVAYSSDITVIDEIQDLNFSVLKLALLLHKGEINAMFFTGDDEQTLDWEPFNWRDHFSKAAELINGLREKHPHSILISSNVNTWWDGGGRRGSRLAHMADNNRRKSLTLVERNIPVIVDLIKDSFSTSVSPVYPRVRKTDGTASIVSSEDSARLQIEAMENGRPHGVRLISEPLTRSDIAKFGEVLFRTPGAPTLVLPSKKVHDDVRELFGNQSPPIHIALWHPVSVKGLEYDSIIAISPWSIDKDTIKNSLDDLDSKESYEFNDGVAGRKKDPFESKYERLLGQRTRFANVILSRPKEHLILAFADTADFDLYDTKKPDFIEARSDSRVKNLSVGEFKGLIEQHNALIERQVDDEDPENHYAPYISMIVSLVNMIKSNSPVANIFYQGAHIEHTLAAKNEKIGESLVKSRAPFLAVKMFIGSFSDKLNNDDIETISPVELREKVVNYFIGSIAKGDGSELGFDEDHPLRMQIERMVGLKKQIECKETSGGDVVILKPVVYEFFVSEYNACLALLAQSPEWLPEKYKSEGDHLSKYFKANLFGGDLQQKSADVWSELLMNFGFSTKNSTIPTDNTVLAGLEVLSKIFETPAMLKHQDYWSSLIGENTEFWSDGIDHFIHERFPTESLNAMWNAIQNQLTKTGWAYESKQQTECILRLPLALYRKNPTKSKEFVKNLSSTVRGDIGEENEHSVPLLSLMQKDRLPVNLIRRATLEIIKNTRSEGDILTLLNKDRYSIRSLFNVLAEKVDGENRFVDITDVYSHKQALINDMLDYIGQSRNTEEYANASSLSKLDSLCLLMLNDRPPSPESNSKWLIGETMRPSLRKLLVRQHGDGPDQDYSMFSDQMSLDRFFEHHPKLIGPVLVELISRLFSVMDVDIDKPVAGSQIRSVQIGGTTGPTLRTYLQNNMDVEKLCERIFNCSYNDSGGVELVQKPREMPLDDGLKYVIFLSDEKASQYKKENEFFDWFEKHLSAKQARAVAQVREQTLGQPQFWAKEAVRILNLPRHLIKKELESKKADANFDFVLNPDGEPAFKESDIAVENNIFLDAVVKKGVKSVFLGATEPARADDLRQLFFDACSHAHLKGSLKPYHYRFGNREASPRMSLSQFIQLNEFVRRLKYDLSRCSTLSSKKGLANEALFSGIESTVSLRNLVEHGRYVLQNQLQGQESAAISTVWDYSLVQLKRRLMENLGIPYNTEVPSFNADRGLQLKVAYANLLSQLFVPSSQRIVISSNPDNRKIPVLLQNQIEQYGSELESNMNDFTNDLVEDQTGIDWIHSNLMARPMVPWERASYDRDEKYNSNNYTHWRLVEVSHDDSFEDDEDLEFFDD